MARSSVANHLIESKFQPQLGARSQIDRARLALPEALFSGQIKLVSIVAPGGYGKSTLMAQWFHGLNRAGTPSAKATWLNLGDNDNDPARLLRYLYGALGKCVPTLTPEAIGQISRTTNISVLLEDLSIRLAEHDDSILLFLDDVHLITAPEAIQVLEWLLRHGAPQLRFVMGSRYAVGWGLAELRLRGQLIELDQRVLAFNSDEAHDFCAARLTSELDSTAMNALLKKTEGWPAGLELLSLALNETPDDARLIADFTTTERGVFDYLSEVVFGQLPEETRNLVHRLAQFDRFCPDLIRVALGNRTPEKLLADLQWRHLFLIPLDGQGRWFRFHHLVSEYLRRHDPQNEADAVATLTAGGQWLFDQGMTDDAIDCAVRAGQWDLACRWLLSAAEDSAQRLGVGANLIRWIPLIPPDILDRYPQIRLSYVFSLAFKQSASEVEREMAALESLLQRLSKEDQADKSVIDDLSSAIPAQRMLWTALRDDVVALQEKTESWLTTWPNARPRFSGDVVNLAAFACKSNGNIELGLEYCRQARAIHEADNGHFGASFSLIIQALLQLKRGDFRAAELAAQVGLAHVTEHLFGHPEHLAYHHTLLAAVRYEFDDLAGAMQGLEMSRDTLDETGVADMVMLTYLVRARLKFQQGQSDAGLAALQLGRKLGQRRKLPRVVTTLAGEECVWLCRLGSNREALELARAQGFDRSLYPNYDVVADKAMRVAPRLLMAEQPEVAIALLSPALVRASEKGFHHRRVELLILQAGALLRASRKAEAITSWNNATELAERFGYRRVFLDDMDMVTVLAHAARGHEGNSPAAWLKSPASKLVTATEEALTRKELRILKLLESGASNNEIAESLFVSTGTLKWHLHNIYRKLGCKNRSGALAAARKQALM